MSVRRSKYYGRLLGGVAAISLLTAAGARAEDLTQFDIAPQPLSSALNEFATQSKMAVLFTPDLTGARLSSGLSKTAEPETALAMMLQGTGLSWKRNGDTFVIMSASDPQSGSAAGDGADQGTVAALIVTAQKKEENIQDVPIAISAFTEKSLDEQKIEGGFDLLKAIPNVTFSKNNFSSYNFSIRGIGTKAISATTDPGVAVSFNNIALIQNRLFEQEYFDVERVEVLRGPQGTLYGRNATAGVINVISAKPNLHEFDGWVKGEVGNYHAKRLSAMVNVPLVEDKLAIRIAGALTDRAGYDYNLTTGHAINGRDLWSARVTVGFNPTDNIRSNLIWERFNEDDNRSRTGKQLCYHDAGPAKIGNTTVEIDPETDSIFHGTVNPYRRAIFSQGCKAGSLYDPQAFGTPNGLSFPIPLAMRALGFLLSPHDGTEETVLREGDFYGNRTQSTNMREVESVRDPIYRAKADLVELNIDVDVSHDLTFSSQTAYNKDMVYSSQDYSRFKSLPFFKDTAGWEPDPNQRNFDYSRLAPGGVFCDPQIGCSNTVAGLDLSQARGTQFSQEIRLQSNFDGPVNFSAGANYTRFKALVDYYVFNNLLTMMAVLPAFNYSYPDSLIDPANRQFPCNVNYDWNNPTVYPVPYNSLTAACPYVDPNPLESIDGEGHNYFRSKNPYKLNSAAAFGELYWNIRDDMKITAGLRYTDDRKTFTRIPTQVLLSKGLLGGGRVNIGYPEGETIKQHWGEWTGRLGVDWSPDLSFTDKTLLYAFYSRGYKGGGANPPNPDFSDLEDGLRQLQEQNTPQSIIDFYMSYHLLPVATGIKSYADTFKPEFVNAFEVGSKNTLMGGALTVNTGAFFYDYKDYQVSKILDRTAVNENFDATIWGLELETTFAPSRNFQVIANFGYLDTKIASGMKSIDLMNRTQSNPNYTLVKPWTQTPSNCIVPTPVAEHWLQTTSYLESYWTMCGHPGGLIALLSFPIYDPTLMKNYDPADYPEMNGGAGIYDDISGNELPNSPHWTMNIGAQYGFDFLEGWRATIRGDAYWQAQSWARVYNAVNDKLHGWYNANLTLSLEKPDAELKIELYAKNILDGQPITDAFINSDDTMLTTNVFTLDPRLIGLSIKKGF